MKKHNSFNATTLRGILITAVILTFLLAGVGFYFAYGWIKSYASTVNQSVVSAHNSANNTSAVSTKDLQAFLQQESGVPALVDQLYAPQSTYVGQAIQDINTYAKLSQLSISNVDSGASTDPAAPGSSTSTTTTTNAKTLALSAGGSTTPITVTLNSPVSYVSLLKFMTYIEHNLPLMQIEGINIQGSTDSASQVQITSLSIGVSTR